MVIACKDARGLMGVLEILQSVLYSPTEGHSVLGRKTEVTGSRTGSPTEGHSM